MNNRIRSVRKKANLTQEAFGAKLGITKSSVSFLESGRNNPSEQTIKLICKEFGVSYQWLVNGAGEMQSDASTEAQAIVDSIMTSDDEFAKSVIVAFAKLGKEEWKVVKKIVDEIGLSSESPQIKDSVSHVQKTL